MSDQPQHPQEDQQEDVLDQIMNKSPAYSHPEVADQPEPAGDAPPEPIPEKRAPSDDEKRKRRSSVYIYLLILFGAAFFMLLLAYFVQQRNSETTISDLRDSMNLSRAELLKEIEALKEENEALQQDKETLDKQLKKEQARSEELEQTAAQTLAESWKESALHEQSEILYLLEKFNDMGDYLMMGSLVNRFDMFFNRNNPNFSNEYLTPIQEARYLELREELFEKSDFMIMEQPDGSEQPKFDDTIRYEVSYAAANLEIIIRFYLTSPVYAADTIATYFQPNSDGAEALYGGAFKRSTVEWFKEIKAELIEQGYLGENEDGTMELLIPYD